jgi:hypothetical protein
MLFEDELGIRSSNWLRNAQVDAFLDDNVIEVQWWEEIIVRQSGLHLSMIRLVVAAILTVPLGFVHRVVPSTYGAQSPVQFAVHLENSLQDQSRWTSAGSDTWSAMWLVKELAVHNLDADPS